MSEESLRNELRELSGRGPRADDVHRTMMLGIDRKKRRRRSLAVGLTVVAVVAVAGVTTAIATNSNKGTTVAPASQVPVYVTPSDRSNVYCFATPDVSRGDNVITAQIVDGLGPNMGDGAAAALDMCAQAWKLNQLQTVEPYAKDADDSGVVHPVPALIGCVLDNGAVAVLPGTESTCTELGLPIARY